MRARCRLKKERVTYLPRHSAGVWAKPFWALFLVASRLTGQHAAGVTGYGAAVKRDAAAPVFA